MRIGSIITKATRDNGESAYIPSDSTEGTVISINIHEDCDGYERIDSVMVRWDDGKVSEIGLFSAEEDPDDWELIDVTPLQYANLYLWDRAYGGSEEGGWWYDTFTPADGEYIDAPPPYGHFPTAIAASEAAEKLEEWCKTENRTRRSPSSTASEGHFVVRVEAWPPEPTPARRPHYC
jgi:hypothetical protein